LSNSKGAGISVRDPHSADRRFEHAEPNSWNESYQSLIMKLLKLP